ncbi:zinc finger CCCH domain-containing protein 1-like [Panicum miliaceum]|uniref:Zinc finger CCCH domain-containing protein 1-like n=1 Tax=Panicum miliaceum TaxID=4540 RepID=A0A3L6SR09_PANMI|nr:zinc finger CCCH domain-containing protein 1-like [Panicum miliaceum]
MPRAASDRARAAQGPRPKCRSGRAVASNLEPAAGGLSPPDPIPAATGSAAPAPKFATVCRLGLGSARPGRRLVAPRHKSTASVRPAAARITLPALGVGFGAERTEAMERDAAAAAAAAGFGASRWEASPDGVIVLPAGSAAPQHARHQRERELEREQQQQNCQGAGVFGDQHPEPPEKVFYKTKLCEKFEAGGKCAYEDGCTFAHGQAELRPPLPMPPGFILKPRTPPPPPPPPPPSGADAPYGAYYGKVCFEFRDRGTCHFGDRCSYAHASAAEVAEMRYPGGPRSVEHALRNAPPLARAAYAPGPRGSSGGSTNSYAPAARAFPSAPAAAAGEDGREFSRLELLSRKKTRGIYGD